jgi:hypothetical protein
MSSMKIKLFVLAGLALAVTAIIVASLFSSKNTPTSTCRAFLTAIEQGNAEESYAMYTDRGKSFVTAEEWSKQVAIMRTAYGNQEPKALGDSAVIKDETTQEVTGERHTYIIKYGDAQYKTTCFTTATEPDKIDSFSSEVAL